MVKVCPAPTAAQQYAIESLADECAILGELKAQLYRAITGKIAVETDFKDRRVRYAQPNVVMLRQQIAYLERQCNPLTHARSAVRMGGYNHRFNRYGANY